MLKATFSVLVGIFVVIASMITIPGFRKLIQELNMGFLFIISGTTFFFLGLVLIFLTVKEKVEGKLKKFLILTGASAAGFFISVLLHNFLYGLFIFLFGTDFWKRIGLGDEPFFFFLAIIVCPLGFLIGVVGSATLFIKRGGKNTLNK
jgi:hypothetical protein